MCRAAPRKVRGTVFRKMQRSCIRLHSLLRTATVQDQPVCMKVEYSQEMFGLRILVRICHIYKYARKEKSWNGSGGII